VATRFETAIVIDVIKVIAYFKAPDDFPSVQKRTTATVITSPPSPAALIASSGDCLDNSGRGGQALNAILRCAAAAVGIAPAGD
jgi:hypothetical protein